MRHCCVIRSWSCVKNRDKQKRNMKKYISYIYVILGAACWGTIGLFNRLLGQLGVSVMNRVTIRNFGAMALLTVVFLLFRRQVFHIKLRHLPIFLCSGLFSVLTLGWCYFTCQQICPLAVASTLLYLAPSFVVLMSAILWKARLTRRKIVALVLAFCGCALVSGIMGGDLSVSVKGILLGVASGFCYATYTIFAHYGLQRYDSYTMIYWTFLVSGLGSLVFLDWNALRPCLTQPAVWGGMAGLVIMATVLPYLMYTKGLEQVEAGKASIISNVEPVVETLVGVIVFHEVLSIWVVLGVVCVLGGVVLLAKEE